MAVSRVLTVTRHNVVSHAISLRDDRMNDACVHIPEPHSNHLLLFWVGASSFQSPHSPVLCFFYLYLFLLHVFSYNTSVCPPILPLLITTPSSVFLPNSLTIAVSLLLFSHLNICHTCPCSYFFIPDLLNPLYSHHPSQHSHSLFFVARLGRPFLVPRSRFHTLEQI